METSANLSFLAFSALFLFPLFEFAGIYFFIPLLFRTGVLIKYVKVDIDLSRFEIGKEYETENAKFKRVSKNSCLIRHKDLLEGIHTPFIIKGEISHRKSGVFLIWRMPLGTFTPYIVFLYFWLMNGEFLFFTMCLGAFMIIDFALARMEWERARIDFFEVKNGEFAL